MSAGTLITLSADEIYLCEHAELGPLDIQLNKEGEVGERTSGLTPIQSMEMQNTYNSQFANCRRNIGMPTKMAADISAELTAQVLGKLYNQLDPLKITEVDRAMGIVFQYAERIKSGNVKKGAVDKLLNDYPAHNFVIDPQECAEDLFEKVGEISDELRELEKFAGDRIKLNLYKSEAMVIFFSKQDLLKSNNE